MKSAVMSWPAPAAGDCAVPAATGPVGIVVESGLHAVSRPDAIEPNNHKFFDMGPRLGDPDDGPGSAGTELGSRSR